MQKEVNVGAAGAAIGVNAAVFPRPWVCRRLEPQVGERVKEFREDGPQWLRELGQGERLKSTNSDLINKGS